MHVTRMLEISKMWTKVVSCEVLMFCMSPLSHVPWLRHYEEEKYMDGWTKLDILLFERTRFFMFDKISWETAKV